MEKHVLYISKNKNNVKEYCKGSKMCLSLVDVLPENTVNVQDCDMLRVKKVKLPIWLNGTPILVSQNTGDIYKGSDAVQYLRELLEEYSEKVKKDVAAERTTKEEPNVFGGDEEEEEEEEDPWKNNFADVDVKSSEERPKPTQQDVDEFMRQREQSIPKHEPDSSETSKPMYVS